MMLHLWEYLMQNFNQMEEKALKLIIGYSLQNFIQGITRLSLGTNIYQQQWPLLEICSLVDGLMEKTRKDGWRDKWIRQSVDTANTIHSSAYATGITKQCVYSTWASRLLGLTKESTTSCAKPSTWLAEACWALLLLLSKQSSTTLLWLRTKQRCAWWRCRTKRGTCGTKGWCLL